MALHDFRCPRCGFLRPDVAVPAALGARQAQIACPACRIAMEWIPAIGGMDFGPAGGAGFKAFTIEEPDQRGVTTRIEVDSLHKLRQIERESERRARNGEGRPLVWRAYAQGRSNDDVHTLATPSQLADPHETQATRAAAKARITPRRGGDVVTQHGTIDHA